jgi:ABC-type multidrug transport system fused ATPase/permease subunit
MRDIRAILGWLDGNLRFRWALLVPIMSIAAVIEAAGAIAVFGLLRMVIEPSRVRSAPVVSELWQAWPTDNPPAIVAVLTGIVAALYVVRALFLAWAEWIKETTIALSVARAGERLFSRYLAADYLFHLRRRSTSLMTEISRSTDVAFQLVVGSLLSILTEGATIVALFLVLAYSAPPAALGIVAVVVALAAIPLVLTRRAWARFGAQQKLLEEQQLHVLQQSLGAVKEVKIGSRESFFESRFRSVRRGLARVKERRNWIGTSMRLTVETVLIVSLLGVILLVTLRGGSGADTVSLLALFAYTGFRAVPSANRIMLYAGYLREGRAYISGAIRDFKALERPPVTTHGPEPVEEFTTALVCENVTFRYDEESAPALAGVSITLSPGESLGIVGATGSGKSTLVDVMLGLLTPTSGRVLLDGADLKGRERAWQRLVGYVPQDPYLLDETVRRNVAFGVPDTLIDEQRLARACSLAQLDDVVKQLPDGLETLLGENGTRLSGGQRQRVAIARALYGDPAVLVFDEATAALDNQTEREVTHAIATLHGARTLIVIAHRLSTVTGCDRLLFLRDGRIAAIGTYDELLRHPAFDAMARPAP